MALLRSRIAFGVIGLLVGVLLALSGAAIAQSVQVKHFACYAAADPTPTKQFRYLPNPADPCPSPSWVKIDWLND